MSQTIKNIHSTRLTQNSDDKGREWKSLELGGDHIGARVEELSPGGHSSIHHFHTAEEEHVLMLSGEAILVLGDKEHALTAGDHVWFAAGEALAHHLENRSSAEVKFLVFGERSDQDVVVYPKHKVMLVKGLNGQTYTYKPFDRTD